jgi:hypothetical protein
MKAQVRRRSPWVLVWCCMAGLALGLLLLWSGSAMLGS